jgi:Cell Wall Hydrolase
MACGMSDNPLDRIPSHDRISLRAVVVRDGEDPGPALAAAGITDPIALPIVFGDAQPDASFGDGITPNLTAVLELDRGDDDGFPRGGHGFASGAVGPAADPHGFDPGTRPNSVAVAAPAPRPATLTLPGAYGLRPLAPVRRFGQAVRAPGGAVAPVPDRPEIGGASGPMPPAMRTAGTNPRSGLAPVGQLLTGGRPSAVAGAKRQTDGVPSTQGRHSDKAAVPHDDYAPNERDLAQLITTEAGGEGEAAMTAVGATVLNRMSRNKAKVVRDAWGGYQHGKRASDAALGLARGLLNHSIPDPTGGATHFYSPGSMPKEGEDTRDSTSGVAWNRCRE